MSEAFLKRTADRIGFNRDYYIEKNIPNLISNIVVVILFGDFRSTFITASLLLKRYKEQDPTKYVILCSWHGYQHLFPYVDEYWSIKDSNLNIELARQASGFSNLSEYYTTFLRSLHNHFENVITYELLETYYNDGFTNKCWDEYSRERRNRNN
jgi:hypothetical protein